MDLALKINQAFNWFIEVIAAGICAVVGAVILAGLLAAILLIAVVYLAVIIVLGCWATGLVFSEYLTGKRKLKTSNTK